MKKNRKLFLCFLLVCAVLLLAAGCSKKAAAPAANSGSAPAKKKLIGLNIGFPDNEFFRMVEASCKMAFDERGWDTLITYGSFEKITENAATLIAQDIDALVDFGCEATYGAQAVAMAKAIGAPTVSIDVKYEGSYFFGANNSQAAEVLGQCFVDWINKNWGGKVDGIYEANGIMSGPEVLSRTSIAVDKIIKDLNLNKSIHYFYDGSVAQQEGVRQTLVDYLSGYPEYHHVAVVLSTLNWTPITIGGIETVGRSKDVVVGSHSEESWLFDHFNNTPLDQENVAGCVAYFPNRYGEYIGKMLDTLFAGGSLPDYTTMEHAAITRENYKKYEAEWLEAKEIIMGGSR
jgi:ribose transport system substrate-binding protein